MLMKSKARLCKKEKKNNMIKAAKTNKNVIVLDILKSLLNNE